MPTHANRLRAAAAATALATLAAVAVATSTAKSAAAATPRTPGGAVQNTSGMMPAGAPDSVHRTPRGAQTVRAHDSQTQYGPDVSSYQHPDGQTVDWQAAAGSGQTFAIVKASEGTGYVNSYFQGDRAAAAAAGLLVTGYHFGHPGYDAVSQADLFASTLGSMAAGSLPPVLDLEVTDGQSPPAMIAWTHAFLDRLQADTGRLPMIYTGPYFWDSAMAGTTEFTKYPLWEASYTSAPAPQVFGGWPTYSLWQYTDNQTIPGISGGVDQSVFRGTATTLSRLGTQPAVVLPPPPGQVTDLYGVSTQHTGTGSTEVHALSAAAQFHQFSLHTGTPLPPASLAQWQFRLADYNGDGIPDLWAINTHGASGHTEVHVLNGADSYHSYLLHTATALPMTSLLTWTFAVADANGDGHPDLYAINTHDAGSHATAAFIVDGANFGRYLLETGTALAQVSLTGNQFLVGDLNSDGHPDIWDIKTQATGSGHTEVHVLNGGRPSQFLLHAASALIPTDLRVWSYSLADYNHDGHLDLYAVNTQDTGSGSTAVHILDGTRLSQFLLHAGSPMGHTDLTTWAFSAG